MAINMRGIGFYAALLTLAAVPAFAQSPVETDPDKYKVIMENERTRVLDYRDHPGDKTHQHKHPDSVLYALSDFKRKLTFPDGKVAIKEFKTGDTIFVPAQTHVGENIGNTDTHVLLVEFKEPKPMEQIATQKH